MSILANEMHSGTETNSSEIQRYTVQQLLGYYRFSHLQIFLLVMFTNCSMVIWMMMMYMYHHGVKYVCYGDDDR